LKKKSYPNYPLRLPLKMKDQLSREAAKERRSLHSEILMRLEQSLNQMNDSEAQA